MFLCCFYKIVVWLFKVSEPSGCNDIFRLDFPICLFFVLFWSLVLNLSFVYSNITLVRFNLLRLLFVLHWMNANTSKWRELKLSTILQYTWGFKLIEFLEDRSIRTQKMSAILNCVCWCCYSIRCVEYFYHRCLLLALASWLCFRIQFAC